MCIQCFDQKKILKKIWSDATEVEGTDKRIFLINGITDEHVTLTFEELEKFTKRHIIRDLYDLRNDIYDNKT
jgi:hypothetical protein